MARASGRWNWQEKEHITSFTVVSSTRGPHLQTLSRARRVFDDLNAHAADSVVKTQCRSSPKLVFQKMLFEALFFKSMLCCSEVMFSKSQERSAHFVFLNRQLLNKHVAPSLDMCSATNLSHVRWCLRESGSQVMNRSGVFLPSLWHVTNRVLSALVYDTLLWTSTLRRGCVV